MSGAAGTRPAAAAVAVAWARFQPRAVELARELGGEACFVAGSGPAPLRYALAAVRTWRLLSRRRPRLVLAVTPPVFAPLVAWAWCVRHRAGLVVDCHPPGSFDAARWAWARPVHRFLLRRCRLALVHSRPNQALLEGWRVRALLLPDDVPAAPEPEAGDGEDTVLVAGSLDGNEPVAEVLAAAALLPDVRFTLTGDLRRLARRTVAAAPPNVTFTGCLPYPEFLAAVAGAAVVAVFTNDPCVHTPRAAFEAVGAGRPLVLIDFPGPRALFGSAAVLTPPEPSAMAAALRRALVERRVLAERSRALAERLRAWRRRAMDAARVALEASAPPAGRVLVLTQHSLKRHAIVGRNVDELLRRGFDVDVICTEGPAGSAGDRAGGRGRLRVFVLSIPHRRGRLAGYVLEYAAFFVGALALASALGLRARYALVQADNLPDSLVFAAVVPRLRRARIVLNLFELTPEMVDAGLRGRQGLAVGRVVRWVEAAAVGWSDRVIVVSEACRDAVRSRGAPDGKLAIVLNTTSWAGPPAPADEAASGELVTHGTLVERYGTHLILEALAMPPLAGARLRVIGTGEQLPRLVDLAYELEVADRVLFTGHLAWGETLAQVRRAAIGIVAVLDDGYGHLLLPTKLLEYARLGVPAVCPRLAAVEDYFPPGSVAYFRAGDATDLAAQVERLLVDPEAARVQVARAREVADALSWERMRNRYAGALGLAEPAGSPAGS